MRFRWFRNAFGIALLVAAMAYSAFTLITPPATASAQSCCAVGANCGPGSVCCKPDLACEFPCNPQENQPGYCKQRCIRCS